MSKRIRNFKVRQITTVTNSTKDSNKVLVSFTDGTFTLRNVYHSRKKHMKYMFYNNTYYKLRYNSNGGYNFTEMGEKERKDYGIVDKPNYKIDLSVPKEEPKVVEEPVVDVPKVFKEITYDPNAVHEAYDDIKAMVKADIPVYLYGPAGCGKNYTIKKIAKELGLEFYFVNSIQDYFKLTGFIDGNGRFHETEFYKAFTGGGLFFLDELDASIPDALILLNAAIANRYFSFPTGQVDAHPDFRVIAAGNTAGNGADELYTGRSVIDISSLDRFCSMPFEYDKNVELAIAEGNIELVNFIRELRRIAKENGIRAVFSYRAIEQTTALEKINMDMGKILKFAIFKGMSIDDINTFNVWNDTKYGKGLRAIQRA